MSKDLDIIKQLEKMYGKRLEVFRLEEIFSIKKIYSEIYISSKRGYAVDKNERVIGLSLSHSNISDFSPIKALINLERLNLSFNKISDISWLKELKNLTHLDLSGNYISDISAIKELKNLYYLDLERNKIKDISAIKELKKLFRLELMYNELTQLPFEVVELGMSIRWEGSIFFKSGIFLWENPLEKPPVEIVKQGTEAIRNYFKEIQKEAVRLLESKLLIVGNGEAGKTTLMKKLKDNNFQVEIGKEPPTHGINIEPWELECNFKEKENEKVKIHFWDFGGQAIYHATHQFFLTKRSLYLFVWESRKEEDAQSFNYWFNIIKLLSAESPVIVVMNKSDIRIKYLDEADFKEKFKNIVKFLQVSCLTGDGIEKLTGQIRTALSDMPHLHDKLPRVWIKIRDYLKKERKDYITLKDYFDICKSYGLNEERAEFLSDYLHDLGAILHYRHDIVLENTVILNPEWVTESVYTLIDTREIQDNKGRFIFEDLKTYWDLNKYPRDKHMELIRLMEKFELCFNFADTDIYIIPELLPADRPSIPFEKYKNLDNLLFEYQYDFMPEGIISRFISRVYYLIKEDHFWKNGVELKFEDSCGLVISEPLSRKMKISVSGSCRSELLGIIRNGLEHIHKTLNMEKGKHYHEMIP